MATAARSGPQGESPRVQQRRHNRRHCGALTRSRCGRRGCWKYVQAILIRQRCGCMPRQAREYSARISTALSSLRRKSLGLTQSASSGEKALNLLPARCRRPLPHLFRRHRHLRQPRPLRRRKRLASTSTAPAYSSCRESFTSVRYHAQEMIDLRRTQPFRSVSEMVRIDGIGPARLADISLRGRRACALLRLPVGPRVRGLETGERLGFGRAIATEVGASR